MNNLQYNLLTNLEKEGIYGKDTIPYLIDGFDITVDQADRILLDYMKLPRLDQAGQVTMERYRQLTAHDIVIAIIALIGVCWALSYIL